MARPIWTGAITFGLVSVPVAMYSATHDHEVSFHQFEKGTSDRIRYKRINERTGKEVDYDNIVKGADVGDGDYVLLDQEELDSVAPGRSRSLDIHRFVELADIDPLYYQKTYWLGPGSEDTAKVYGLLRDAMADSGRAAVGTLVMRGKEYLTTIRAEGKLLVLQTMFFADEVRDPADQVDSLPSRNKAKPAEMHMAQQLIDSMSGPWKPADFRDTYTDRVKDLVKAKAKGEKVKTADPAPEPTAASDLFEILRKSVEAASQRRATSSSSTSTAKKSSASSASRKKSTGPAAKKSTGPAAKKPTGSGSKKLDVAGMSKADLLKLARKLDVPGRSSMSRPELEKAVRKAA
ncbi:non-homologous end joining protein Ku [Paractinoplanes brasiliensis]|uniref:Non-homologous end joining protein Ku n=1 Tax=Paractinoplanes brasiliensis TaxID=52695 RepID=A0A4V3C8M5_9ACTN|nr:Ku protein [Actinoplanes brasiliensis]TDO42188.1 DNA end-binding protein Ku [Actinoplanes brasiliensis]GID31946.1 non-homologous end joining protein Ku [Actinoplanes brasiliensis]